MTSLSAPVSLSRQRIMRAALEIIDDEGLDLLTMRRLGQAIGREAMALYRYTPNRDAILDGVLALAMEELQVQPHERWQDRLRAGAHDFRAMILRHPNILPLLASRPLATPLGDRPPGLLHPVEGLLTLFRGIGFGPSAAVQAYRLYTGLLLGQVVSELQLFTGASSEAAALARTGLDQWSDEDFPVMREHASQLSRFDGAQDLDRAMTILIDGLETELDRATGVDEPAT